VDYARFERLVIGIGAAAIVGTATFALRPGTDPIELVALLLLLAVVVGAVRWGRRGGTTAAVGATLAYIALKALAGSAGLTPDVLGLFALRAVMYFGVGVLGGEACSRMKLVFARAHDARAIDESTSAYTSQFLARVLYEAVGTFERYNALFSVVVISIDGRATTQMRPSESADVVRTIALRLRKGLRLVDDLGRLPWGAFAIVLPQTGRPGANTVADRLRADLRDELRIEDAAITVRVLSATEDLDAIKTLAGEAAEASRANEASA
jgi:GGDEF domain-containing protein